jgi:hypothetical protein
LRIVARRKFVGELRERERESSELERLTIFEDVFQVIEIPQLERFPCFDDALDYDGDSRFDLFVQLLFRANAVENLHTDGHSPLVRRTLSSDYAPSRSVFK